MKQLLIHIVCGIVCTLFLMPISSAMAAVTRDEVEAYIVSNYGDDPFILGVISAMGWHESEWDPLEENHAGENSYGMLQVNMDSWWNSYVHNGQPPDQYKMENLDVNNNWQYAIDVGVSIFNWCLGQADADNPDFTHEERTIFAFQKYNNQENRGIALWHLLNSDVDGYREYFPARVPAEGLPSQVMDTLPEPCTMFLLGSGLMCLLRCQRRRGRS